MDVSKEALIDEVFILRNRIAGLTKENEELQRELARASDRVIELEEKIEAIIEQSEEPYV